MKKIAVTLILILFFISGFTQSSNCFNYQAVLRDKNGSILSDEEVSLRISILQGSVNGTKVYSEVFLPTTNEFGLVNLSIGSLYPEYFDTISWENGPYFIQVQVDPEGRNNFVLTGTSQLLSVPFALYAKKAGGLVEKDPFFSNWDKSSGISINSSQISDLDRLYESDEFQKTQIELDRSQQEIGLNPLGYFLPIQTSYFISEAISFSSADSLLDVQVNENLMAINALEDRSLTFYTSISSDLDTLNINFNEFVVHQEWVDSVLLSKRELDSTIFISLWDDETIQRIYADSLLRNDLISILDSVGWELFNDINRLEDSLKQQVLDLDDVDEIIRSNFNQRTIELQNALDQEIQDRMEDVTNEQYEREEAYDRLLNYIRAIQKSAGFTAFGTYFLPENANYIVTASSLKEADVELDHQLKILSDQLSSESSSLDDALTAEIMARQMGDSILAAKAKSDSTYFNDALDTEISNRETSISNEAALRLSSDNAILDEMTSDSTYLKNLIDDNNSNQSSALSAEISARQLGDSELAAKAKSDSTYFNDALDTEISNRETGIINEAALRLSSDNAILDEMTSDSTYLKNLIDDNNSNQSSALTAEISARQLGDSELAAKAKSDSTYFNDALDTEISNRETSIINEAALRLSSDNAILDEMTSDSTYLKNLIDDNKSNQSSALTAEISARQLGDSELAAKAKSDSTYFNDALDTEISNRETSISNEAALRLSSDNAILDEMTSDSTYLKNLIDDNNSNQSSALTAEISARQLGDSELAAKAKSDSTYFNDALDAEISNRETSIINEAALRLSSDNAILDEMTSDSTYLKNLIDDNNSNQSSALTAEISARQLGDSELAAKAKSDSTYFNDALDTEISNRETSISNEAALRLSSDNAILDEMTSDSTYLKNLIDDNNSNQSSALIAEISARQLGDSELAAKAKSDSTYFNDALDTEISNRETSISNEAALRLSSDNAILDEMTSDSTYLKNLIDDNNSNMLKKDGSVDLTSDWIIETEDISLLQGTMTSNNVFITNRLEFNTGAWIDEVSTDGTMNDNSDNAVPTEKAVKTFVETVIQNEISLRSSMDNFLQAQINSKAPLASAALTGAPTAPTFSTSTNSTAIATTAFVHNLLDADANTLDEAYDQGGAGSGNTIIADHGAFTVGGFDGIISTGINGLGSTLDLPSGNAQFVWYPKKSSFRVGTSWNGVWADSVIGNYSIAMGIAPKASFTGAVAIGSYVEATKSYSIAIGCMAKSTGDFALALGQNTISEGNTSTAMGNRSIAKGDNSTAMGANVVANATNSTAMGFYTTANAANSTVLGKYNTGHTNSLFEIGNGSYSSPGNIVTVTDLKLTVEGDIENHGYFYFGDEEQNGTWRMYQRVEGLRFECRENGSWIEKMTILK